jgi:adenylate cyclase
MRIGRRHIRRHPEKALSAVEAQSQELPKLNQQLKRRVTDQVGEIERMGRLRRFLPPQVADLIVAYGTEKQLKSHRREITALFCDLCGFTGFTESADAEDVMALLRDYHAALGEVIIKYNGTLERYAGDGVRAFASLGVGAPTSSQILLHSSDRSRNRVSVVLLLRSQISGVDEFHNHLPRPSPQTELRGR